jgi:hypothetical protein
MMMVMRMAMTTTLTLLTTPNSDIINSPLLALLGEMARKSCKVCPALHQHVPILASQPPFTKLRRRPKIRMMEVFVAAMKKVGIYKNNNNNNMR